MPAGFPWLVVDSLVASHLACLEHGSCIGQHNDSRVCLLFGHICMGPRTNLRQPLRQPLRVQADHRMARNHNTFRLAAELPMSAPAVVTSPSLPCLSACTCLCVPAPLPVNLQGSRHTRAEPRLAAPRHTIAASEPTMLTVIAAGLMCCAAGSCGACAGLWPACGRGRHFSCILPQ